MKYYKGKSNRDVISVIKEFDLNFNLGNVLKYMVRGGKKSKDTKVADLKKAIVYLKREIEYIEGVDTPKDDAKGVLALTKMQFATLLAEVQLIRKDPSLRVGQAFMIALHKIDRELYDFIAGTDSDPFYLDSNLDRFQEIIRPWGKSG